MWLVRIELFFLFAVRIWVAFTVVLSPMLCESLCFSRRFPLLEVKEFVLTCVHHDLIHFFLVFKNVSLKSKSAQCSNAACIGDLSINFEVYFVVIDDGIVTWPHNFLRNVVDGRFTLSSLYFLLYFLFGNQNFGRRSIQNFWFFISLCTTEKN